MNRTILILCIILTNAAFAQMQGRVISVHDGDSFTILAGDKKVKVRVAGIDCPELDQPFGKEAFHFTDSCIRGKVVQLKTLGYDKYHRLLAEVFFNKDNCLQYGLLRLGYAWSFDKYNPPAEYRPMSWHAQRERLGLWADMNSIPPWEWRHKNAKLSY